MQKCKKCSSKFNWKEIFKSFMLGNSLVCKKCGLQHKIKLIFRMINSFLMAIPILLIPLFHLQSDYTLFGYIIYAVLISLLMPFWTKYNID